MRAVGGTEVVGTARVDAPSASLPWDRSPDEESWLATFGPFHMHFEAAKGGFTWNFTEWTKRLWGNWK
jgi:hypothetical protein